MSILRGATPKKKGQKKGRLVYKYVFGMNPVVNSSYVRSAKQPSNAKARPSQPKPTRDVTKI